MGLKLGLAILGAAIRALVTSSKDDLVLQCEPAGKQRYPLLDLQDMPDIHMTAVDRDVYSFVAAGI